jgi:hypothetical protein
MVVRRREWQEGTSESRTRDEKMESKNSKNV